MIPVIINMRFRLFISSIPHPSRHIQSLGVLCNYLHFRSENLHFLIFSVIAGGFFVVFFCNFFNDFLPTIKRTRCKLLYPKYLSNFDRVFHTTIQPKYRGFFSSFFFSLHFFFFFFQNFSFMVDNFSIFFFQQPLFISLSDIFFFFKIIIAYLFTNLISYSFNLLLYSSVVSSFIFENTRTASMTLPENNKLKCLYLLTRQTFINICVHILMHLSRVLLFLFLNPSVKMHQACVYAHIPKNSIFWVNSPEKQEYSIQTKHFFPQWK